VVLASVLLSFITGCAGYRAGWEHPAGIERVHVAIFDNATRYGGLEFELVRHLQDEFRKRSRLRLVEPGEADAVLKGTLLAYGRGVLRQDPSGGGVERQVVLRVRLEWIKGSGEELIAPQEVVASETYEGDGEVAARAEAMQELAQRAVNLLLEWW
jgi:hypothetical protein